MAKKRTRELQETNARVILAASAIRAIQRTQSALVESGADERTTVALARRIAAPYWVRLQELSRRPEDIHERRTEEEILEALQISATEAERRTIVQLLAIRAIGSLTASRLNRELNEETNRQDKTHSTPDEPS